MGKIKVIHDLAGRTLTVWLDDPAKEASCQETTDEVVLIKDAQDKVIGFEMLNVATGTGKAFEVETVVQGAA
jgi:DNA topoisomerase IB